MNDVRCRRKWIDLVEDFDVDCIVDSNDSSNITMPTNETLCLKDDSGELPIYLIDGEVNANGRFTSVGETVLVQEHEGSSFDGIGFFEGTGTFNGTKRCATDVALVEVETVPGVSYEPKKLKIRSGVPTPAVRRALAPRKMGRRPKDAPEETEAEKRMRAEERLFRNRESAARSREKKDRTTTQKNNHGYQIKLLKK